MPVEYGRDVKDRKFKGIPDGQLEGGFKHVKLELQQDEVE